MLIVASQFEVPLSKRLRVDFWHSFMNYTPSRHSAHASTLPYLIRRAEQEKIAYQLSASPGQGYIMQRLANPLGDDEARKAD